MPHSQGAFGANSMRLVLVEPAFGYEPRCFGAGASFHEWQPCHSIWSSLLLDGTGRHGRRFWRGPGGFPRSRSEPGSRKSYEAPDNFPAPGLLHVSPVVTGTGGLCCKSRRHACSTQQSNPKRPPPESILRCQLSPCQNFVAERSKSFCNSPVIFFPNASHCSMVRAQA